VLDSIQSVTEGTDTLVKVLSPKKQEEIDKQDTQTCKIPDSKSNQSDGNTDTKKSKEQPSTSPQPEQSKTFPNINSKLFPSISEIISNPFNKQLSFLKNISTENSELLLLSSSMGKTPEEKLTKIQEISKFLSNDPQLSYKESIALKKLDYLIESVKKNPEFINDFDSVINNKLEHKLDLRPGNMYNNDMIDHAILRGNLNDKIETINL
jgi:hypothetical protein